MRFVCFGHDQNYNARESSSFILILLKNKGNFILVKYVNINIASYKFDALIEILKKKVI